ncbi:MAG TPA: hypothetical protein PKD98_27805, partial [Anaerolineae bacterium]|nr:hypothetical protein [Anaerolineae bacterium]
MTTATSALADPLGRLDFFQRSVLANLHYWQAWVQPRLTDSAALDPEHSLILRALAFALDLKGQGWAASRELIELLSPYMERRGHWDSWNQVLGRALQVARQLDERAGIAALAGLSAR